MWNQIVFQMVDGKNVTPKFIQSTECSIKHGEADKKENSYSLSLTCK